MKKICLCFVFLLNCFFQKSFSQTLPDQNKFYSLVNAGTHEVLASVPPTDPVLAHLFPYPNLISVGQINGAGIRTIPVRWKFTKINTDGFLYTIQMQNSENVFDIFKDGRNKGDQIILHKANQGANQRFFFIPAGEPNTFYISSLSSGLLLDGTKEPAENGKNNFIKQMGFNGSIMQKWVLETVN